VGWNLNNTGGWWVDHRIAAKEAIESKGLDEGLYIDTGLIISYIIKCSCSQLSRQWARKIDEIIDVDDEKTKGIRNFQANGTEGRSSIRINW
jgi:hypothetical protein